MGPAEWPTKCISSGCKAACTDHNLIFCITKLFKRSLICKDVQLYQVRLVRQCNSVINIITITVSQHHSYFYVSGSNNPAWSGQGNWTKMNWNIVELFFRKSEMWISDKIQETIIFHIWTLLHICNRNRPGAWYLLVQRKCQSENKTFKRS